MAAGLLPATSAIGQPAEPPEAPAACPGIDAKAVSLAQAARRAVCLAPSLRLADAQAQLEQGALSERRARLQPEWSLSATPARSHQWGTEPVARSTSASGSIAVSQVLFDGGARAARVQQGEQDLLAAAEDRRSSELDAVLAFVDLWVQFRNAEAGAASARDRARDRKSVV